MRTRIVVGVVALVAAALATTAGASLAHASAYRYWTYWTVTDGAWVFAPSGPAFRIPADGTVEGWRFSVTSDDASSDDAPRPQPDFDAVCADATEKADMKRIALVVDYGEQAIAPAGQQAPESFATCVVIDDSATGYDVLRSVGDVRTDNGLICGVGGYPADECAPLIDEAEQQRISDAAATVVTSASGDENPTASAPAQAAGSADDSGSPLPTLLFAGALAAGALIWLIVRQRSRRMQSGGVDSHG